jgi:hypothetical protein
MGSLEWFFLGGAAGAALNALIRGIFDWIRENG